jgi:hypothetical protein
MGGGEYAARKPCTARRSPAASGHEDVGRQAAQSVPRSMRRPAGVK